MNTLIRKGTVEDAPVIFSLITELALFENEPEAVDITLQDLVQDGFGACPLFEVFVAELEDTVVGMALFYHRYSTWKGRTIHLEDLIVKEEHRGKGLGRLLYDEVLKYAQQQKVRRVEWCVLDWNIPAIDFYKGSGAEVLDCWRVVQISEGPLHQYVNKI